MSIEITQVAIPNGFACQIKKGDRAATLGKSADNIVSLSADGVFTVKNHEFVITFKRSEVSIPAAASDAQLLGFIRDYLF